MGKEISWKHIEKVYEDDQQPGVGLTLLPKIKREHIKLTSFSKMRVDLAAQVIFYWHYNHTTCVFIMLLYKLNNALTGSERVSSKSTEVFRR